MRTSKFFERVFAATLFLYLFFLVGSLVTDFSKNVTFINYNVGIVSAMTLFYLLSLGFNKREFNGELNRLVKQAERENRYAR